MRDWWKRLFYGGGIAALFASASFTVYCAWNVYAYPRLEKEQVRENANEAYHFVLVPEELDNDYWRLVEKGAKAAAKELGVDLEYIGPRQANIDEHLRILKKAAAAKVDGIITQGLTKADFVPVIDEIADKGIPVVTVDTDAPTSRRAAYVGTDNYYAGFIAGRALVEDTRGAVNVAIITGSLTAAHQQLRVQGFQDAVKREKRIRIVAVEESHITRVQAAEKAYMILKKHPDVNAFYGTSALDAIGIAKVVEQFHRENKTYIIGFDTLPETIRYLQKGTIAATVVQEPYEMGYRAVNMMAEIVAGRDVPKVTNTETKVIRKQDLPLRPARNYEVNTP
ncbi:MULTISPECIES: sugar-binding protein [Geobacillus]|uniref:LacI family transcriptional regulator n=1 Tax=Geobacillus thermocatenulatus TaxID=33938 RepID=A0A226Q8T8_9BACL|nr:MULTISPECIES: sugar-binding protein [Geobacillus]ASS98082.1 LacI family transcriptional regulator [Geobacillus thermocatenulatus]KLR74528.1 LacI family transcriptional regulator [Geobacillus sp. T6]OXB88826.1 LacI family transcriptional regulator [Geobacillus thermocatenulatus]RAN22255.1 LacI family transcriptional regulator [Geobacillus sp. A8]